MDTLGRGLEREEAVELLKLHKKLARRFGEDAASVAILKVLECEPLSVKTFAHHVARNHALDTVRRGRRHGATGPVVHESLSVDGEEYPGVQMEPEQERRVIAREELRRAGERAMTEAGNGRKRGRPHG